MLLLEMFASQYATQRLVSDSYYASVISAIRALSKHLGREAEVSDLSDETIYSVAGGMVSRGLSRASANRVLRTLAALARFAYRRKLTGYRPDLQPLIEKRIRPVCWRHAELNRLLAAIRKLYGDGPWSRYLIASVLLCYDTAARIGDVLRIDPRDCDLRRRIVRYTEKKTGDRRAFVIAPETLAAVARVPKVEGVTTLIQYPYRFTNPLAKRLRRALVVAGLPSGRKDLFQKLRRTTLTRAKSAGMDPTEVAGHSAKWVTDTFYVDADESKPIDVASQIPRPKLK